MKDSQVKNESGIEPLLDRIIVKRHEYVSKGGIILTDGAVDEMKPSQGEVIAVGPDVNVGESRVCKPGDKIVWGKYAGFEIVKGGVTYTMMSHDDPVGIIDKYEEIA